jgi:Nucleotidyltransferase domain
MCTQFVLTGPYRGVSWAARPTAGTSHRAGSANLAESSCVAAPRIHTLVRRARRQASKSCGVAAMRSSRSRRVMVRVFGSVARGEAGPDSDVDFLVEMATGTLEYPGKALSSRSPAPSQGPNSASAWGIRQVADPSDSTRRRYPNAAAHRDNPSPCRPSCDS